MKPENKLGVYCSQNCVIQCFIAKRVSSVSVTNEENKDGDPKKAEEVEDEKKEEAAAKREE